MALRRVFVAPLLLCVSSVGCGGAGDTLPVATATGVDRTASGAEGGRSGEREDDRGVTSRADPGSLDELAGAEGTRLCAAGPLIDLGPDWTLPCDELTARSTHAGTPPLEALAVDFAAGGQIWSVLAVRGAGETRMGTLASGWAPGIGGHSVEGATTVEARDLIAGGAPEIVATFSGVAADSDMGSCDYRGRESVVTVLCTVDGGGLRCVAFETTRVRWLEHTACDEAGEADGGAVAPDAHEIDVREGFELALALDGGVLALTPSPTDTVTPPLSGELSIVELTVRHDLAWPAHFATVALLAN